MPELKFESRLESDQGACFIRVPPEVLSALGQGKRAPVKVRRATCPTRCAPRSSRTAPTRQAASRCRRA